MDGRKKQKTLESSFANDVANLMDMHGEGVGGGGRCGGVDIGG